MDFTDIKMFYWKWSDIFFKYIEEKEREGTYLSKFFILLFNWIVLGIGLMFIGLAIFIVTLAIFIVTYVVSTLSLWINVVSLATLKIGLLLLSIGLIGGLVYGGIKFVLNKWKNSKNGKKEDVMEEWGG